MREQVTIQQVSETSDGGGGYTSAWSTLATVWARIQATSGTEPDKADQLQPSIKFIVTTWYRSDVTTKMRIVWGSRTLRIYAILPDEKQQTMNLECEEQPAA